MAGSSGRTISVAMARGTGPFVSIPAWYFKVLALKSVTPQPFDVVSMKTVAFAPLIPGSTFWTLLIKGIMVKTWLLESFSTMAWYWYWGTTLRGSGGILMVGSTTMSLPSLMP